MDTKAQGVISGRVQRVGFRAYLVSRATALGLSGWTRNTSAGDVEFYVSGNTLDVEAFLIACRAGPRWAKVDDVLLAEVLDAPFSEGFCILPTT